MPYFWYSEKMKAHLKVIGEPHGLKAKLTDGQIAGYTLESIDQKEPAGWDNFRFAGQGEFHEMMDD